MIVVAAEAPHALQMPAAGLSAESGAPILFVTAAACPGATAAVLARLRRPAIYVLGAAAVRHGHAAGLRASARVTAIAGASPRARPSPTPDAATRSRSRASPTGRSAGGSKNPATASCSPTPRARSTRRPRRRSSASGDYGPLLLLESATGSLPSALARYLGDIQPAYTARRSPAGARRLQSRLADRRRTARSRRSHRPKSTRCWRSRPRTQPPKKHPRRRRIDDRPRRQN